MQPRGGTLISDAIHKQIELKASPARVWRALTDFREFGAWFRVALNQPFAAGATVRGHILHPGFEHIVFEAAIEQMIPEKLFSWTWAHPESHQKEHYSSDYAGQPRTRVEFRLEPTPAGTLLTVTESGFSTMPDDRRERHYKGNEGGWEQQMKNIEGYLGRHA